MRDYYDKKKVFFIEIKLDNGSKLFWHFFFISRWNFQFTRFFVPLLWLWFLLLHQLIMTVGISPDYIHCFWLTDFCCCWCWLLLFPDANYRLLNLELIFFFGDKVPNIQIEFHSVYESFCFVCVCENLLKWMHFFSLFSYMMIIISKWIIFWHVQKATTYGNTIMGYQVCFNDLFRLFFFVVVARIDDIHW